MWRVRRIYLPWDDAQARLPSGLCVRCGAELYGDDTLLCNECEEELEHDRDIDEQAEPDPHGRV